MSETVLTAQKTVKATGHDWDEGKITKSATCEEKGVKTYTGNAVKKQERKMFRRLDIRQ